MATSVISGSFTESTKGKVTKYDQKGYAYGVTAESSVLAATTDALASPIIGSLSEPKNAFSNKKITVGLDVTVAFADVAATLIVEGSPDGTNWATVATASSDVDPHLTGVKIYLADLTGIFVPFYRLILNKGGLIVGTSGKAKFIYAIPAPAGA